MINVYKVPFKEGQVVLQLPINVTKTFIGRPVCYGNNPANQGSGQDSLCFRVIREVASTNGK